MELVITNKKGEKFTVLYDECDHELVAKYTWHINSRGYAMTNIYISGQKNKMIGMHRLILGITNKEVFTDHKNRNRIDNRRCNIRPCTRSENSKNKNGWGGSIYLGVSKERNKNKTGYFFRAAIKAYRKSKIHIGVFYNEEDAARAYDEMAKIIHGEFANLNFK